MTTTITVVCPSCSRNDRRVAAYERAHLTLHILVRGIRNVCPICAAQELVLARIEAEDDDDADEEATDDDA